MQLVFICENVQFFFFLLSGVDKGNRSDEFISHSSNSTRSFQSQKIRSRKLRNRNNPLKPQETLEFILQVCSKYRLLDQCVVCVDWTGLGWTWLYRPGLCSAGVDWTWLDWAVLGWAALHWTRLHWTLLYRAGLVWAGLGWTVLSL